MRVKKDDVPVIYKQDIMDNNGKLNKLGALLVVGCCIISLNQVLKYLKDNIIDKDNVN